MTWFGNYDRERWKHAMDACEAFFKAVDSNGFYKLVEKKMLIPVDTAMPSVQLILIVVLPKP